MNSKRPHALRGARGPNSWNKIPLEAGTFASIPNVCPFSLRSPHTKTDSARNQTQPPICAETAPFLQGPSHQDALSKEHLASVKVGGQGTRRAGTHGIVPFFLTCRATEHSLAFRSRTWNHLGLFPGSRSRIQLYCCLQYSLELAPAHPLKLGEARAAPAHNTHKARSTSRSND